jgi:hypothetical protein
MVSRVSVLCLLIACLNAQPVGRPILVAGRNGEDPGHPPVDWNETTMGPWNATEPSYNPATGRLLYQSSRGDLAAKSYALTGACSGAGLEYFSAGPVQGIQVCESSPATVIYVDGPNGGQAFCIGCEDVIDDGSPTSRFFVYKNGTRAAPGTHGPYAVQSKQIPTWHPSGRWIAVSVEMPAHIGSSASAGGETGYYNDLWAVSDDGRTWVQLTDFAATWPVEFRLGAAALTPYRCNQSACSAGCQYVKPGFEHPYDSYWCSAAGQPPPAGSTISPDGYTPVVWGEQVGSATSYTWQSIWQLQPLKSASRMASRFSPPRRAGPMACCFGTILPPATRWAR